MGQNGTETYLKRHSNTSTHIVWNIPETSISGTGFPHLSHQYSLQMAVSTCKTIANLKEFLLHTRHVKHFLILRNTIRILFVLTPSTGHRQKGTLRGFLSPSQNLSGGNWLPGHMHTEHLALSKVNSGSSFRTSTYLSVNNCTNTTVFTQQDFCNKPLELSLHPSKKFFKTYYANAELKALL